jgi:predicted AAA+ superfamily ATPase
MNQNFPRFIKKSLETAMQDTPVVFINGPRQSGKTTLVKEYASQMQYFTLDDDNILNAVKHDPIGFINNVDRVIIDEIQRAPELMRAIKLSVDKHREAGRFLLTGSANLMALPQLGDSLAGRMEILSLYTLSLAEIQRKPTSFIQLTRNKSWKISQISPNQADIFKYVISGGYPEMLARDSYARRNAWAKSYLRAIVDRDIKDIATIEKLVEMPKLLEALAEQSGKLTNFTQIGAQLNLDTKTTQKYVGLLETLFLVKQLRPWRSNSLNRIIKTPKIYFIDSGLLASLKRMTQDSIAANKSSFGAILETWVYDELLKLCNITEESWNIYYYRDKEQVEVDFILENYAHQIIGIEVKASHTIFSKDFRGLRKVANLAGKNWLSGIVLYPGTQCLSFGENFWAIPLAMLL